MEALARLTAERQAGVLGKARADALTAISGRRGARVYLKNRYGDAAVTGLGIEKRVETAISAGPAAGATLRVVAISKAYQIAKDGGRNSGFLRNYEVLPDHLIGKAIKSLERQVLDHRAWIEDPRRKVGPDLTEDEIGNLVRKKWPKDILRIEEQIAILGGLLQERRK